MTAEVKRYFAAARRGADWLLAQQNPDGSFVRPDVQADVYHKAGYALAISGHPVEANRLLSWIAAHDLSEGGRLRHFDPGLALYKTTWTCQAAHRLGRFDVSLPVMEYVLRCQAPCGGFYQVEEGIDYLEPVCTSWAGVTAIYLGRMEAAERAAEWVLSIVRQQPDWRRFYYWTDREGKLATEDAPVAGGAPFVDATKPQQPYYCAGIACLFLTRLYLATGHESCLAGAQELFAFSLRCAEDAYSYPTAGKGAVAAALLYALTGDERARRAVETFADYLVAEQREEGWWCNPHNDGLVVRLDHTAEFVVFMSELAATLGAAR